MKRAIYAGSFDPITKGHIDIIQRAMKLFDQLIVVVAQNSAKKTMFNVDKRIRMIRKAVLMDCLKDVGGIKVMSLPEGEMLVNFAAKHNACAMIRGLRPVQDFPGEFSLASINRRIAPSIETVMLITDPSVSEVSSSMVKELVALGGPYEQFVPENVATDLRVWKESQDVK